MRIAFLLRQNFLEYFAIIIKRFQEVKEKAITASGLLISTFGDYLEDKVGSVLAVISKLIFWQHNGGASICCGFICIIIFCLIIFYLLVS